MKLESCKNLYEITKQAQEGPSAAKRLIPATAIGAGLGGLGMGIYSALNSAEEDKKEKAKEIAMNILMGMTAGGGLGAGVGSLKHYGDVYDAQSGGGSGNTAAQSLIGKAFNLNPYGTILGGGLGIKQLYKELINGGLIDSLRKSISKAGPGQAITGTLKQKLLKLVRNPKLFALVKGTARSGGRVGMNVGGGFLLGPIAEAIANQAFGKNLKPVSSLYGQQR